MIVSAFHALKINSKVSKTVLTVLVFSFGSYNSIQFSPYNLITEMILFTYIAYGIWISGSCLQVILQVANIICT